jgi:hypothetical protein
MRLHGVEHCLVIVVEVGLAGGVGEGQGEHRGARDLAVVEGRR